MSSTPCAPLSAPGETDTPKLSGGKRRTSHSESFAGIAAAFTETDDISVKEEGETASLHSSKGCLEESLQSMHNLPSHKRVTEEIRELYDAIATGELATANYFWTNKRDDYVTYQNGKDQSVYTACPETLLWKLTPFPDFTVGVQYYLSSLVTAMGAVFKGIRHAIPPQDKDNMRTWNAIVGKVETALRRINSFEGGRAITRQVFTLFRVPTLDDFDANRSLISFKTEVFDASTGIFRPRTKKDKLTAALSYDAKDVTKTEIEAVEQFFYNIFEDTAVLDRVQTLCAYLFLGRTNLKMFLQLVNQSNCGKTTMMAILCNAMEFYASNGEVPVAELCGHFSGALITVLSRHPPVRMIVVDEIGTTGTDHSRVLNDSIFNVLADGKESETGKAIALNKKFEDGQKIGVSHAKLVILSNGPMCLPFSKSGLYTRSLSLPMDKVFQTDDFNPRTSPSNYRKADLKLAALLESETMKPAIAAWIISAMPRLVGKLGFDINFKNNPFIARATFETLVLSDPYARYLTLNFMPTGFDKDVVAVEPLLREFAKEHEHDKTAIKGARNGFSAVVERWNDILEQKSTPSSFGFELSITGMRAKKIGDVPWYEAVPLARGTRGFHRRNTPEDLLVIQTAARFEAMYNRTPSSFEQLIDSVDRVRVPEINRTTGDELPSSIPRNERGHESATGLYPVYP